MLLLCWDSVIIIYQCYLIADLPPCLGSWSDSGWSALPPIKLVGCNSHLGSLWQNVFEFLYLCTDSLLWDIRWFYLYYIWYVYLVLMHREGPASNTRGSNNHRPRTRTQEFFSVCWYITQHGSSSLDYMKLGHRKEDVALHAWRTCMSLKQTFSTKAQLDCFTACNSPFYSFTIWEKMIELWKDSLGQPPHCTIDSKH